MTDKMPLVSIIVPVYNVDRYIKKCLDSIKSQSYKNIEVIVVDDGSTDMSGNIADEYVKTCSNFCVFHKKNGGLSDARNFGLKKANGEWVAFIDSDDYVEPEFIEKLLHFAIQKDADMSTCSFRPFTDDASVLKKTPVFNKTEMSGIEAINYIMEDKLPIGICFSIFKTDLFKKNKIEFPLGREHEDLISRFMLLYHSKKVAFLNEKLYNYLSRTESITGKKLSLSRYNDMLFGLQAVKDFLSGTGKKEYFTYYNYFEMYSLVSMLNYIVKNKVIDKESKEIWKDIRKRIKKLFGKTIFPTNKKKCVYALVLLLSANRPLYSFIYGGAKKWKK